MSWSIYATGTAAACERQVKAAVISTTNDAERALFDAVREQCLLLLAHGQKPNEPDAALYTHKINCNGHGVEVTNFQFSTDLVLLK
jgi:hypothetical protein